jgi:hypothetical protein
MNDELKVGEMILMMVERRRRGDERIMGLWVWDEYVVGVRVHGLIP